MRIVVAVVLFIVAAGFAVAAIRGPQGGRRLAGTGLGVAALFGGFAVLFNAVGQLSNVVIGSGGQQADVPGDNNTVVVVGPDSNVTIGDRPERYREAVAQVAPNYLEELGRRISEVEAVESVEPSMFWDGRRPNETSTQYEERARAEFDRYVADVERATNLYPVDTAVFRAREVELGFDASVASAFSTGYDQLRSAHGAFTDEVGLLSGLRSLGRQASLSDAERVERARWLWEDKRLTARISLLQSAAAVVDIDEVRDSGVLELHVERLGVDAAASGDLRAALFGRAGELSAQRAEHLKANPQLPPTPSPSDERTEGSLTAQLSFEAAAISFLEADGRQAAEHFRDALATQELSDELDAYARASIDRLENVELYQDAIGIFVLRLDGGRLRDSGIEPFDTIVSIDGQPADEVAVLTGSLVGSDVRLTVLRDGELRSVTLGGSGAGGAVVTQLVVLNAVQI